MLAALFRTSWSRVPGLGLESERPAWRARRGLGAGFPLDFFEGTTNLTKRKNIVTEGKAAGGEMPFKCCRARIKRLSAKLNCYRTRWQEWVLITNQTRSPGER